jgi:DNA-binding PadR family transcriptional regulator
MKTNQANQYLPRLTPIEFNILIALLLSDQHGLGLIQAIAERTAQEIFLSPGTLYSALKRMYKDGWIEQSEEAPPAKDGNSERRRYYRLAEPGYEVLIEETKRMERIARETRALLEQRCDCGHPGAPASTTKKQRAQRERANGKSHDLPIDAEDTLLARGNLVLTSD